jgi:LuxR family maltose regulon positive regulatory protein
MNMHPTISLGKNQLLATKFYAPIASGSLVARPRLNALLRKSLKHPLTLISAPAGFGKTTALSTWVRSLQASHSLVAWLSLDEEDNDPQVFWTYVLAALEKQHPERFGPLLQSLQSSQAPPLKFVLTALINLLLENDQHAVLVLDDYHLITTPEIHTDLSYLVKHIPPQFHLILATRSDPPLQLAHRRAHEQVLEIRTQQLRCTREETRDFFQVVMGLQLPNETLQQVTSQAEGWLVGLKLLGLSLPERADPLTLLGEVRGDQRYILDFLTQEVLRRQPQEVQTFLLSTCILERFTASLCDAVMEQSGSQQTLERLERANLFLTSLDHKREWYRYHALFAEALHSQLEQNHADLVPILHTRASRWYAQHHQTTAAILHAFKAHEWHWAADLIEQAYLPLISFAWGANKHALVQLRQWIEQLPTDILARRPRFCLSCVQMLWTVTPQYLLHHWLDLAKSMLTALLKGQTPTDGSQPTFASEGQQELENLLGEVFTNRAFLWCYVEEGHIALALCEQALALLSPENAIARTLVAITQLIAYYASSANDMLAAVKYGQQSILLSQTVGEPAHTISVIGIHALYMIGAGRLHEVMQLTHQALQLGTLPTGSKLPDMGWPAVLQAEVLREWNELDAARSLATEGISLCEQTNSLLSLTCLHTGYAILIRLFLSCGDLEATRLALQQLERLGISINQPWRIHMHSLFTTVDQVRLWLACGELDRATRWAEELDLTEKHVTPFARERQEVAQARILLAKDQPTATLQRLEPRLQRATAGQRWGHVIEIRLLQALAHQRLHEEPQALAALSEAVRLGEPEGYIRSFVEEGEAMAALLSKLREEQRKRGPTPYLDRVLAAFPKPSQPKRMVQQTLAQSLQEPLSERELQVLKLLAKGASNLEIAQGLVIAVDTVKRHVSHIFAKLGVQNRVQAVRQARKLGLLDKQS